MQIQNNTSFTGINFYDKVRTEDLGKLQNFLQKKENIELIKSLDQLKTDIFFSENMQKIGFEHRAYGNLDIYGAKDVSLANFNPKKMLDTVCTAVKNAAQDLLDL